MKGESAGNHAQAKRKYQPTGKGQQGKIPETLKGAVCVMLLADIYVNS